MDLARHHGAIAAELRSAFDSVLGDRGVHPRRGGRRASRPSSPPSAACGIASGVGSGTAALDAGAARGRRAAGRRGHRPRAHLHRLGARRCSTQGGDPGLLRRRRRHRADRRSIRRRTRCRTEPSAWSRSISTGRSATWRRLTRSLGATACSWSRTRPRPTGPAGTAGRAGSLGDVAAFSFYPSKNLGALGDGGAICTDDEAIAERARRLRNLGQRAEGRARRGRASTSAWTGCRRRCSG